jgi:hypothetical protein
MRARKFDAKSFTGLQLMRLDHRPAVAPASPGKPRQWTFVLVDRDGDSGAVGFSNDFALRESQVLCPKVVELRMLRIRNNLFVLTFCAHARTR